MDKEILKGIADNPALFEAVRTYLLSKFDFEADMDINTTSNEQLGQIIRAKLQGAATVELAFREIARMRSTKDNPSHQNPAR